jgi:hypothetical protein
LEIAILVLLPLVGGYIFAGNWDYTRYKLAREDGHRLYFRAAFWGVALVAALMVVHILFYHFSGWYQERVLYLRDLLDPWFKDSEKGNPVDFAVVATISMLLAYPLASFLNRIFHKKQVAWVFRAIEHDDIERILHRAASERRPIAVTMANRKVYVGFVIRTFDPAKLRKSISVLPLMSGHRMEQDGRLKFTTFYTQIYGTDAHPAHGGRVSLPKPLEHMSPQDFEVALPLELVQSLSLFDLETYRQFQHP